MVCSTYSKTLFVRGRATAKHRLQYKKQKKHQLKTSWAFYLCHQFFVVEVLTECFSDSNLFTLKAHHATIVQLNVALYGS